MLEIKINTYNKDYVIFKIIKPTGLPLDSSIGPSFKISNYAICTKDLKKLLKFLNMQEATDGHDH